MNNDYEQKWVVNSSLIVSSVWDWEWLKILVIHNQRTTPVLLISSKFSLLSYFGVTLFWTMLKENLIPSFITPHIGNTMIIFYCRRLQGWFWLDGCLEVEIWSINLFSNFYFMGILYDFISVPSIAQVWAELAFPTYPGPHPPHHPVTQQVTHP